MRLVPAPDTLRHDAHVIGLVGSAHFVSHFFQLVLPPLFPVLRAELGVSYVALGAMMTVFFAASGIAQTVAGFLVDRFGAPRVLVSGIALLAAAMLLAGLAPSFSVLVVAAGIAGLGNSVFHPADYAIFNAALQPSRLGRAYSVHGVCGSLGWATAPAVVITLTTLFGWRRALVTIGGLGVVAALALATQRGALSSERRPDPRVAAGHRVEPVGETDLGSQIRLLFVRPIMIAFAYFALLATSLIGLQTFSVTALVKIYEAPVTLATGALTMFLLGSSGGVLAGGFLADRTRRHDVVASGGLLAAATLALVIGSGVLGLGLLAPMMAVTGFCLGVTSPSRDMLVRAAAPPGASGRVYGFVYSGLDLGSCLTPLFFGWILDQNEPRLVFVLSACLMVATIFTVVQVRRSAAPIAARMSAG
ncbi:MAG: MFS transporter [Candidatus Rokubacteria bacterium]|nr:MFS transporter [Candidatus Rokubacteria bacterium]